MSLLKTNFNSKFELFINGRKYYASKNITISDHVFNNAGSVIQLSDVYPADLEQHQRKQFFKVDKFSLVELRFGGELFKFGVVKVQQSKSLNPRKPQHLSLTVATYKEFLTQEPMDFSIIGMTPEQVVNNIVTKLGNGKIKVGTLALGNSNIIQSYDSKSKTAYDMLRFVEKHTNSMLEILEDNSDETISINFFTAQALINTNNGNKGVDMDLSTVDKFDAFNNLYKLYEPGIYFSENNKSNANKIRVESERIISDRTVTQTVDLSTGISPVSLSRSVGTIDKSKSFATFDGKKQRIVITTRQEVEEGGKQYDVYYEVGTNEITINERLLNKNGILTFVYSPIERISLDFEDSADQLEVAASAGGGSGELFQYEKYNDITNVDSLVAMGERHRTNGVSSKIKLMVDSAEPIWELGQQTYYTTDLAGEDAKKLNGSYVVRQYKLKLNVDEASGALRKTFQYDLIKSQDFENELNFSDSLAYRDNPLYAAADASTDVTRAVDTKLFVLAKNIEQECVDIDLTLGDEFQFEFQMEFNHPDEDKLKYKIIDLKGSV